MQSRVFIDAVQKEGRAVRATFDDDEASIVLAALGVNFEVGLARARGQVAAAWAFVVVIGGAAVGGGLGAWLLGGVPGLLLGALAGAAVASRAVGYRVTLTMLPGGKVGLAGSRV